MNDSALFNASHGIVLRIPQRYVQFDASRGIVLNRYVQ